MWAKTNWDKKVKWGITGLFGFLILVSAISGSSTSQTQNSPAKTVAQQATSAPSGPTSTPKPTNTPAPTPTPIPKDANGFPMDAQAVTVANLDKAPSQYNGKKITFTCTVAGFAKDSSGNAAAVNCSDPNDFSSIVQVDTSAFDNTKINQDDRVRFYGVGMGSSTGKNAFGGEVSETVVMGLHVNDITSGYKE